MNFYETIHDIEELRGLCERQGESIKDLRKSLDFELNVTRNLKEEKIRLEDKVDELEEQVDFYKSIIEYMLRR